MTDALLLVPETLLEHREFLHAIARRLLDDESRADDIVQEAWLAAIERPPEAVDSLRAWLARVVRHLALNVRRGEARRARRELECARRESTPGTAEIASRLAVQKDLATAVAALTETHREVVYLRFFEDLPPRAIAARLGIPVETVRSRVRRALERLRRDLDAMHRGNRRAWCLALVHVAGRGRRGGVAPASPLAGAWLFAAALMIAAVGALVVSDLRVSGALPATADLARPQESEKLTPLVAVGGAGTRIEAAVETSASAPLALRILDIETGEPLPEVSVTVMDAEGGTSEGVSDDRGEVNFYPELPIGLLALVVTDGMEGTVLDEGALQHVKETAADPPHELHLRVGPTYRLQLGSAHPLDPGEVVCELYLPGEHRAGAFSQTVRVRPGPVPWVRFAPLPDVGGSPHGRRSVLVLRARTLDGRLGAEARAHVWPGRYPRSVELELAPRATARGEVRDESGRAIEGAVVRFAPVQGGPSHEALSDDRGAWELGALPLGEARMTVRSPAHESHASVVVLQAEPDSVFDSILRTIPSGELSGRLTSESGGHVPVGPVRLVRLDDPERRFVVHPQQGGDEFRYSCEAVPQGVYRVLPPMGDAYAWRPAWREVAVPGSGADFECLDAVPTDDLAFRVHDVQTGEPIERFRVLLQVDRERRGWDRAAELDAQLRADRARYGEIAFRDVPRHLPLEWLVIAEGRQAEGGSRGDLFSEDGRLVGSVLLQPRLREHLWVGTRNGEGHPVPLSAVEVRGCGALLARTLGDGHAILDLAYDPGMLELVLPGWSVVEDPRLRCPIETEPYAIRRVWMAPDALVAFESEPAGRLGNAPRSSTNAE